MKELFNFNKGVSYFPHTHSKADECVSVALFNENVAMYDINNTGGWYDFGFLIGVGGISFSSRGK